ncbi:helix-turn-helix transcriptional regulator [Roseibium polysiphoniae]|uniref:helix-turn-helix domain-containing protein n=1 Tax=Roseibium polysiphoniae TaxID=2571221 RepID=UPI003298156B
MKLRNLFARNLKAARLLKGMSQEDLAYEAELDRTYISALERRIYSPSLDVIEKLSKALELDAYLLLMAPDKPD